MKQYLGLLQAIKDNGNDRGDRTGTGTRSLFGYQARYDLQEGFPLLTTKALWLKGIIYELLWMIKGDTNVKYLQDQGVKIWNEWADANGDLGPVYGHQWRSWRAFVEDQPQRVTDSANWRAISIDQLANVIQRIKDKPEDRRLIVSAWNVADIEHMKLPPCHCFFQFYTRELSLEGRVQAATSAGTLFANFEGSEKERHAYLDVLGVPSRALDCQLYQRSCDVFLGVPYNIASYSLLTMMIAQVCGMAPGTFIHTYGDVHIYNNHKEQVDLQLTRSPRKLPTMTINPSVKNIDDFQYEDFVLHNYEPHPHIAAPVAV